MTVKLQSSILYFAAGALFDEDEDDIFGIPKSGSKKDNIKSSLIPDDDDEDDDMFSMPKPGTRKPETKSPLLPDEEDDDMFSSITKKTSVKEPVTDKNDNSKGNVT